MPVPYRASSFKLPLKLPPPMNPEELEALMVREMGPRPPVATYEPLRPVMARSCRFHPRVRSCAAIHRGRLSAESGWVLLCESCASALSSGALTVVDHLGRYQGAIPAPRTQPLPL